MQQKMWFPQQTRHNKADCDGDAHIFWQARPQSATYRPFDVAVMCNFVGGDPRDVTSQC